MAVLNVFFNDKTIEYVTKAIFDYLEFDKNNVELINSGLDLLENLLEYEERQYEEEDFEYIGNIYSIS